MAGRELFAPPKKQRWDWVLAAAMLLLLAAAAAFLNHVSNKTPVRDRAWVTVSDLPNALEGVRFLHMSDLHGRMFGRKQDALLKPVADTNYRAVCLTGDMVGRGNDPWPLVQLIKTLPGDVPVLFVAGDDDPAPYDLSPDAQSAHANWVRAAEAAGAVFLETPYRLDIGKSTLWFLPMELVENDLDALRMTLEGRKKELSAKEGLTDREKQLLLVTEHRLNALRRTDEMRLEMLPSHVYIALNHTPLSEESLTELHEAREEGRQMRYFPGRLSLILAGHLNAGQVHLPLIGPLWAPPSGTTGNGGWLPRRESLSGLTYSRGVSQYVTPGLGAGSAYPWWARQRFFNPPAVSLLQLTVQLH